MAKGKSSASSGTRKKPARRAAQVAGMDATENQQKKGKGDKKGGKKGKDKEPRKKVYIPPSKPAPVRPDPLDTLGIAQIVPAELLVVLRKLAKKDGVTKRRALEDLQADWVERARSADEEWRLSAVTDALPVWLHHFPSLLLHPSRRIRILTASLHTAILRLPSPTPERLFSFLSDVAEPEQVEYIIGTWLLSAYDVDRQVAGSAKDSWTRFTTISGSSSQATQEIGSRKLQLDEERLEQLWTLTYRTILDPIGIYTYVNPPQPAVPPPQPHSARKGPARTPHGGGRNQGTQSQHRGGSAGVGREEDSGRTKSEEDEESEEDKSARLRVAGIGAAEWIFGACIQLVRNDDKKLEEFVRPLENPLLWSTLYHAQYAPFCHEDVQALGYGQPAVRRAAWSFLTSIVSNAATPITSLLPSLSSAVLRSAWVEPDVSVRNAMWGGVLGLLKAHPEAWTLATTIQVPSSGDDRNEEGEGSEDEDDSDDGSDEEPDRVPSKNSKSTEDTKDGAQLKEETMHTRTPSPAYQEFLQFLELGCMGTPTQAYPAVLVVLSTIPSSIIASTSTPLQTLFTSFWAAVDGRALSGLDRAAAGKAFLSAVLECAVYVSRRIVSSDEGGILLGVEETEMTEGDYQAKKEAAKKVVSEQVKRAWEEVSSGRLKVEERGVAELLARTLKTTRAEEDITDSAWQTLSESIKSSLVSGSQAIPSLLASTLKIFAKSFELGTKLYEANKTLTEDITKEVLVQVEGILQEGDVEKGESRQARTRLNSFVGVIDTLGGEVFKDDEAVLKIDETVSANAWRLLILSPRLLGVYLAHRNDDARRTELWRALLFATAQHPDELSTTLSALLDIVANTSDPVQSVLRPDVDELDGAVQHLLLEGGSHVLLKRLLRNPDPFISRQCFTGVLSTICNTFAQHVDDSLHGRSVASSASVDGLIGLLVVVTQENVFKALSKEDLMAVLADVFVFTYIVPLLEDGSNGKTGNEAAKTLWDNGVGRVSGEVQTVVIGLIKTKLRDLIVDCSVAIRPSALVNLSERGIPHLDENVFSDIVLAQADLDTLLSTLPGQPTSVSLAVTDPLVLPGEWDESDSSGIEFDKYGFSPYARLVNTLLLHFLRHRDLARQNIWALRHLYALKIYAQDVLDVPFAPSPVFGRTTDRMELGGVVQKISQIAAYLLSEDHEQGWLAQLALRLTQNKTNSESHAIEKLLKILISPAQGPDAHRDARILRLVLQHLFASAEKTDAEAWLVLARGVEKSAPYAALAITYSVTQYAPEPPRLDRLRNELAANALGIPASKANTEGLWTLRRLAAVAPDPESDIVYLPTPRAVNLMKACQQWITSDEDLDEAVDSEMTSVFLHLAPILQNMPGSHWDLVFDVIENNLENCSFDEHSTLPLLSRTLQLIIAVEDLASTNRSLRSGWDERRSAILTIVRDLTAKKPEETAMSTPLSVCREHALTIVQDLPQKLIGNDTLSKMCHLVTDASESVPQMAYKMLREAAYKRTEFLVVEASVDTDETLPLNLPEELVQLLQQSFLDEDIDEGVHNHHVFGYLLTWMLVFDLFTNASLKVKSGYMDHLRRENLVEDRFLPQVFTILRIYGGPSKAFKLDIWEVDEFYLEMYSTEIPLGLQLLAAHLYYRALLLVPSLIRNWLLDCRDRQLSATVTNYTSAYFSPFIVRAELAQVKDPSLAADLADENFTVKVANAINEITAAFAVDEYSLELKLRLPTDFPLHPITTKDSNRIGVTEERWRSWVLGVQQILTFRSGNIVDGLAFFKKNVTSHFEGQSECAICYSMISAMDGSLPTKPCKTCKNRFHAGCLYKWFNTSHSSSCPLCRSEIIQ